MRYTGVIIEESLEDKKTLEDFEIVKSEITDAEDPTQRWHLYTVEASKDVIERLPRKIRAGWYAHFWKGREVVAVFKDRKFEFNFDDKETWKPAIEHGVSLGISEKELDFPIE